MTGAVSEASPSAGLASEASPAAGAGAAATRSEPSRCNVDNALALAASGYYVFPVLENSKLPAIEDFPNKATRDEKTIRQWWGAEPGSNPLFQKSWNVGISTSRFGDPRADGTYEKLVVIDVDVRDGKNGVESLAKLRKEGLVTPETRLQATPSGGYHYIYRTDVAISNSVGTETSGLGNGLDIRGVGGFIVGAGSIVPKGTYKALDLPVAVAHDSLIERCTKHTPKVASAPIAVDETAAVERVREYLKTAKPAIEGSGGNQQTFKVAARCKDLGTDAETTYSLMLEVWNERCQPPWEDYELETLVKNAYESTLR